MEIVAQCFLITAASFRTLVGIIDEYFEGYFTEEMIESQVKFYCNSYTENCDLYS